MKETFPFANLPMFNWEIAYRWLSFVVWNVQELVVTNSCLKVLKEPTQILDNWMPRKRINRVEFEFIIIYDHKIPEWLSLMQSWKTNRMSQQKIATTLPFLESAFSHCSLYFRSFPNLYFSPKECLNSVISNFSRHSANYDCFINDCNKLRQLKNYKCYK